MTITAQTCQRGPGQVDDARSPARPLLWRPVLVVGVGLAVLGVLSRRVGGPGAAWRAVSGAHPLWLLLTAIAASGSYVAAGLVQHGAVSRSVPLGRLVVVQVACAFTNRLLPSGVGGMATNVRGLRKAGSAPAQARLAVGVTAVVGVLMHVVIVVAAAPVLLTVAPLRPYLLPGHLAALVVAAALASVALVLLHGPGRACALAGRLGVDGARLWQITASPRDVLLMAGGSLGITACHAAAFAAALHAVGLVRPLPTVLALYVVAVAAAGLVPTPGGVGGVDAALLLALSAVGAPVAGAAAAVLVFRLVTFWLPVLPGVLALLWLLHRRWL